MRRTWFLAALLVASTAAGARAAEVPIERLTLPVPRDREVRLDFPVGTLRVEAVEGTQVTMELDARCRRRSEERCAERADRVTLHAEDAGGALRIRVEGYPKFAGGGFSLRGVLRVPRDVALRIEMGVGALSVRDVEGGVRADLGVGDADIRVPARAVSSVDVSTGVGDATVVAAGSQTRRRAFVSATASWDEGRGHSRVSLNVGVGDATVRVD